MGKALAAVLLGLLSVAAPAADDLIETEWKVAEDGSLLVWPHPENSRVEHEAKQFRPMVRTNGRRTLGQYLVAGGLGASLPLALPGPVDLASHCDAKLHFRRLGLGLADEDLVRRIAAPPEKPADDPIGRRARLDRLLAVRLAADRKLMTALPALRGILGQSESDPILAHAAWEAVARLDKPPRPLPKSRPLDHVSLLGRLPANCDVVILADQRNIPRWRGWARRARESGLEQARMEVKRLGAAVTPLDLAVGQYHADLGSELPYEMARMFGNARILRSLTALKFGDEVSVWHLSEGVFEMKIFRKAAVELGLADEDTGEPDSFSFQREGVEVRLTPTRFSVVTGEWVSSGMKGGGAAIATELIGAGAMKGHALWAHLRHPVAMPGDSIAAGLLQGTLTVGFKNGIQVVADLSYSHDALADAAAKALQQYPAKQPFENLVIARPNACDLVVTWPIPGSSATEAIVGLVGVLR